MAGIAMMLGGALANAFAFSGSNALFSSLQRDSVAAERKRHDEAIEKTQKAQAEWARARQEKLDAIAEQLRLEQHAETTFDSLDRALAVYKNVLGERADAAILQASAPQPTLGQFYTPSEEQKQREYAFVGLAMAGSGVAARLLL